MDNFKYHSRNIQGVTDMLVNLSGGYTLHNFKQKTLVQLCDKGHRF